MPLSGARGFFKSRQADKKFDKKALARIETGIAAPTLDSKAATSRAVVSTSCCGLAVRYRRLNHE
jgi:hypothetical protein